MNDNEQDKEQVLGLYWKGKRTTVDKVVLPFQSLELIETINESRVSREKGKGDMFYTKPTVNSDDWRNKLIWGDNKYVMSALLEQFAGKIDLIYIDPPFATGANFDTTVKIGDSTIEHTKAASAIEELAYRDTWGKGLDSFLQMMYDRLLLMRELLSEKGSIYVHIDYRTNSYVRCLLDEIFGTSNFRNEIIWQRTRSAKFQSKFFSIVHDTIFLYTKTSNFKFNSHFLPHREELLQSHYGNIDEKTGRRYTLDNFSQKGQGDPKRFGKVVLPPPSGKHWIWSQERIDEGMKNGIIVFTTGGTPRLKRFLDETKGEPLQDIWIDIPEVNSQAVERIDYPTQKPETLLERIIKASSDEGDIVADFFCGSGTTAATAEKMGRRWITSDLGRYSIHTTRKRMLGIDGCKPFEILNIGKYERQYWQTIHFGTKTKEQTLAEYVGFILKLYKAESLPGGVYIHGKKGSQLVHVGSVEAPITIQDVQSAVQDCRRMGQKNLVMLGWEWEMGLYDIQVEEAAKQGVKLLPLNIPREVMDKRAVDAGDVQFFELAYLETDVKNTAHGYQVLLKDFVIPNLDLIPAEVKKLIKKWSDYIDYWSVDWDYKNDTFHNQWQSYRTKQDRSLELKTDPHPYAKKGDYNVMVKVIDIFGNDTTHIVEIKHR